MPQEITKADVQQARQALAKAPDAQQQIEICERCDIEIEDVKRRCNHAVNFLTKFLLEYGNQFPGRA